VLEAVLWGIFGGMLGELLNVYDHRTEDPKNWPAYLRMGSYYAISALMGLCGGGLAAAYQQSGVDISPIVALNVGLTAPLILKTLQREAPALSPGKVN
jgi:hypothetical protein